MLQDLPLHALVVHLPIALTVLIPLFVIVALVLGRRWVKPHLAWGFPVGLLAMLMASAYIAQETGEDQEDTVEKVVDKEPIHEHEEAAELFLLVTGGVLVVSAGGLLPNKLGGALRVVGAVGSLAVLGAGWNVGHSGGQLVYKYNAGAAYSTGSAFTPSTTTPLGSPR